MPQPPDLTALTEELASLRARLDEQAAELAGLHARTIVEPVSRRHLLRGLAGVGAAGVAGVVAAAPASADDGDKLVLGQRNTSTSETSVTYTSQGGSPDIALQLIGDGRTTLAAVVAEIEDPSDGRSAIWAINTTSGFGDFAILASAMDGTGVYADNESSIFPAITGQNRGNGPCLGGVSSTGGPQLYLEPGTGHPNGPPTADVPHAAGYIRFDAAGDLWVCTATGTPGTWTRLLREDTATGRIVAIAPVRALDTRATGGRPPGSPVVPGQKKGPLKGGTSLTLDLAGAGPIPGTASGVLGNLTVVSPTYAGFLSARPSGAPATTSSINFTAGATVANAFTSQLGPAGLTISGSGAAADSYQLIVDVTAYIT